MSGVFSKAPKYNSIDRKRKFHLSNSSLSPADLQIELHKLSIELSKSFPGEQEGEFDYLEAKKCYHHYSSQYEHLTIDEWDNWIYDKFLHTCYGLDIGDKIIHSYRLYYGSAQTPKTVVVFHLLFFKLK